MNAVISADIEGTSGVVTTREIGYPRKPVGAPQAAREYQNACAWLAAEVDAAVEGALEAGAQRVVVHDSHSLDYTNILADELHPSAELVKGMPVIFLDPEDLSTGDYSACLIVGAHARGGQAARYVSWMPQMSYDRCCTVGYEDGDYLRVYKTLVAMFGVANLH